MPPRYTASGSSMFGAVGSPNAPRPGVDIPGAIDALAGGASSLIQGAYVRKRQQLLDTQAQQQREFEQGHQTAELAFQQKEAGDRGAERAAAVTALAKENDRRFVENGGVLAHTEEQPTITAGPTGAATPITPLAPVSPIASALLAHRQPAAVPNAPVTPPGTMPGVQATPSAAPPAPPSSVPTNTMQAGSTSVNVPESFDATKGMRYIQGTDIEEIRRSGRVQGIFEQQEGANARNAASIAGRTAAAKVLADSHMALANANNAAKAARTPVGRATTGNAQQAQLNAVAYGYIQAHNGDRDAAQADLQNTPQGQQALKDGLTPQHITAAYGKWKEKNMAVAGRLQTGALGMDPSESVDAVTKTGTLLDKSGAPAAATPPATTPAAPAAAAPVAPSGDKPKLSTPAAKVAKPVYVKSTDYTRTEITAANAAGKKDDASIAAWIDADRAAKKKAGTK